MSAQSVRRHRGRQRGSDREASGCSAHGAVPDAPQGSAPPSLLGGLVGRGSESRGAGPREVRAEGAGISPTKVAGVSGTCRPSQDFSLSTRGQQGRECIGPELSFLISEVGHWQKGPELLAGGS